MMRSIRSWRFAAGISALVVVTALGVSVLKIWGTDAFPSPRAGSQRLKQDALPLKLDPPTYEIDVFDEVGTIRYQFAITNDSNDQTVRVKRIVADCGCTATYLSKEIISPGDTVVLTVDYNVRGISGVLPTRTVNLFTDHPDQPKVSCRIGGTRHQRFTVDPPVVDFGRLVGTTYSERTVSIYINATVDDQMELDPDKLSVDHDWLRAEVVEKGSDSTNEYWVNLAIYDPPEGSWSSRVVIPVRGHDGIALTIPVRGEVPEEVAMRPSRVLFGVIPVGTSRSEHVEFRSGTKESVTIDVTDIYHSTRGLEVTIDKETDRAYLTLRFTPDSDVSGAVSGSIDVGLIVGGKIIRKKIPFEAIVVSSAE